MKRFLQDILIVLGILMMFSISFDYVFSNYLKQSKARKYVGWNDIIYDSVNADLLVIGSSRAWVQYDTYIMDSMLNTNSYNLGIDGSLLNRQMLKYRTYEHYQKRKAKAVIINVDYYSTIGNKTIGYEYEQFFPYLWNRFTREEMRKTEPFTLGELYLPMYRFYKQSVYSAFLESNEDTTLYNGYEGKDRNWDGSKFLEIDTWHFNKNEEVARDFDRFLDHLKEQNVKIVFVCAPIYIGLTYKVDNLPEFYATFQTYSDKYQIPILDYTYYYLSYDTAFFYSALHLNKTGAELFTTKLCHDLDSLGLLKQ